jgi:NAD(P)-dependent dehydrogenase (short-subunit alcohol dehydrogenase family)
MLRNKVVIITGGAGLLGQEFVKAVVLQQGVAVIADISEDTAFQVQQSLSLEYSTDTIDFIRLDITSVESIKDMISTLHEKYGRIDALVNNAYPRNKRYGSDFFDVKYEDFCENVNLNLGGYFLTSQELARYFRSQKHGNIINVASIYGIIAPKFEIYEGAAMTMPVEYAAIKSAIIHLTKYLAKYFRGMNIRVNALSPGGVFDGQPEIFVEAYRRQCINKGMLDKSDLCGTLVYLLSDMSSYVNGQNLTVDDGFSL